MTLNRRRLVHTVPQTVLKCVVALSVHPNDLEVVGPNFQPCYPTLSDKRGILTHYPLPYDIIITLDLKAKNIKSLGLLSYLLLIFIFVIYLL